MRRTEGVTSRRTNRGYPIETDEMIVPQASSVLENTTSSVLRASINDVEMRVAIVPIV
jgi:hypothetical protein